VPGQDLKTLQDIVDLILGQVIAHGGLMALPPQRGKPSRRGSCRQYLHQDHGRIGRHMSQNRDQN
jgi:hypothetical protein